MASHISAAAVTTSKKPDTILDTAWLNAQFNQIDAANALILKGLDEVKGQTTLLLLEFQKLGGSAAGKLIPELESAIKRNSSLSHSIDRKVPDAK